MKWSGKTLVPVAFLVVTSYFLFRVHEVLLPFILAAVLAYLFNPMVRFFEVRGMRRRPVVVILYVSLMSMFAFFAYKLAWVAALEAAKASHNMPVYVAKGTKMFDHWRATTHMNHVVVNFVAEHGRNMPREVMTRMPSVALGILPILELAFLVPFIGFFIIQAGPKVRDHLLNWVPSRYVEMVLGLMVEVDNSLGKYLRGLSLEAFCVACIAYMGFWAIGLDYRLQIAVVMGLANFVPYVGPIVGAILGGGVAMVQWGSAGGIFKVLVVCGLVRVIEDWVIQPTVMRRAVHMHPVLIMFSLMAGAKLFGFWGLLFAVPLASMVKVLLDVLLPWYRSQYGFVTPTSVPEVNHVPFI